MHTPQRPAHDAQVTFQPPEGTAQVWAVTTVTAQTDRPLITRFLRYRTTAGTWAALCPHTALHHSLDDARTAAAAIPSDPPGARLVHARPRPRSVFLTSHGEVLHDSHGPDFEHLGARLGYLRRLHHITQQQAADAARIPRTAVSEIESGTRKTYAIELRRLAAAYGHPDLDHLLHALGEI